MRLFIIVFLIFSILTFGFADNYTDGVIEKKLEAKHSFWEKAGITIFITGISLVASREKNNLLMGFAISSVALLWLSKKKKEATLKWSQEGVKFKSYNGKILKLDWRDFGAFLELTDRFRGIQRTRRTWVE